MDNTKRELFCRALWQAFEEKRDEELALCDPPFEPSARHLYKVSRILGVDVQKETEKRYYHKKRALAILLAAALLLASAVTVYAYRGAIFGFIEKMFEDHVEVGFDGVPEDAPSVIEEVYTLGYVPQGFELMDIYADEWEVDYTFKNERGDMLAFWQTPLGINTIFGVNDEYNDTEIRTFGKSQVYCRLSSDGCAFLWRDEKYAMQILTTIPFTDEEILAIIDGIYIKE